MGGRDHEHDVLLVANFVEESPGPNAVPPRLGLLVLQLANVKTEARVLRELRIDYRL